MNKLLLLQLNNFYGYDYDVVININFKKGNKMKKILFFAVLSIAILSLPACKHLKCDKQADVHHEAQPEAPAHHEEAK